jgi:hypothetical protein
VVPLIINTTKFHVRLEISLENKVYPKTYYHHSQANIEVDETLAKIQAHNLTGKYDYLIVYAFRLLNKQSKIILLQREKP